MLSNYLGTPKAEDFPNTAGANIEAPSDLFSAVGVSLNGDEADAADLLVISLKVDKFDDEPKENAL